MMDAKSDASRWTVSEANPANPTSPAFKDCLFIEFHDWSTEKAPPPLTYHPEKSGFNKILLRLLLRETNCQ